MKGTMNQTNIEKVEKEVIKSIGKRCKDFEINCHVCQCYMALEILVDYYGIITEGHEQN